MENMIIDLLPEKPKEFYVKAWKDFCKHSGKMDHELVEADFVDYFQHLKNERKLAGQPYGAHFRS